MSMEKKVYCGPVIKYKMNRPKDNLFDVMPDEPFSQIPVPDDGGWYVAMPNWSGTIEQPRQFYDPDETADKLEPDDVEDEMNWLFEEYSQHINRLNEFASVVVRWGFYVWWA